EDYDRGFLRIVITYSDTNSGDGRVPHQFAGVLVFDGGGPVKLLGGKRSRTGSCCAGGWRRIGRCRRAAHGVVSSAHDSGSIGPALECSQHIRHGISSSRGTIAPIEQRNRTRGIGSNNQRSGVASSAEVAAIDDDLVGKRR